MGLFLGWSGLILLVMLVPLPGLDLNWIGSMDSLVHLSLFLILGGLAHRVTTDRSGYFTWIVTITGFLLVVPEILQHIIPTRGFSLIDLYFNLSGATIGVLLASTFVPLVYLGLGSIGLGTAFGSSLLKAPAFDIVFAPAPDILVPIVAVTCLLGFVFLMAHLSGSTANRFLVFAGGISYLLLFRQSESALARIVSGGLLVLLMLEFFLEEHDLLSDRIASAWKHLVIILFVTTALAIPFEQEVFLVNAGTILGVGSLPGVLVSLGYAGLTRQQTLSRTSSGQS